MLTVEGMAFKDLEPIMFLFQDQKSYKLMKLGTVEDIAPVIVTHVELPNVVCCDYTYRITVLKNFHFVRYIVGYTVVNIVLRRRSSGVVKRDFRAYIRRYTSPNENFEYGYLHSNALV